MNWLFGLLAVGVVFAVLQVLPTLPMTLDVANLEHGVWFWLMSISLVGCAFLWSKFSQLSSRLNVSLKLTAYALVAVLMGLAVMLFAVRTVSVQQAFESSIPTQTYTVQATVHVHEVSDSVYDKALQSHYRQRAVLSDLVLVENTHKHADNAKDALNPFYTPDTTPQEVPTLPKEMTVMLSAFASQKQDWSVLNTLTPNTKTTMTLVISPVVSDKTNLGFDSGRWLRTRHVHANAKILAIDGQVVPDEPTLVGRLQGFRQTLREHFYQDWHTMGADKREAKAVTLALLTGDRALINRDTKELYQFAGISHLLAISGTHVVFLAIWLAWGICRLTDRWAWLYQRVSRTTIRLAVMVGASLVYALFTGFDVPAVRTVYMLITVAVVSRLALPMSPMTVLLWVGLGMIWLDPVMVWQAGFWLSFVAVGLLMRYGEHEFAEPMGDIKNRLVGLLKLQTYLFFAMLPLSVLLFGKVSLWGLIVNLFAVGLFGAVIVPINLVAGVLFGVVPFLSDVLWGISTAILGLLNDFLKLLQTVGEFWLYHSIGGLGVVFLMLAVACFVVPMMGRKFAIVPLTCCLFVLQKPLIQADLLVQSLPSDDNKISRVLIRQTAPDVDGGELVWLVMSDFGGRMDDVRHAKELTELLKKHRISQLTGVIVQTPSPMLAQSVERLRENFAIYQHWQAGKSTMSECVADKTWQGSGLTVSALTGWTQVEDTKVWGCSVMVESQYTPTWVGLMADGEVQEHDVKRFVINGATDGIAWQMYDKMCHDKQTADVWLTHTGHDVDERAMSSFAPKQVLYLDKDTPESRRRMREKLF